MLAQAAILELYDPDRSRHPVQKSAGGEIVSSGRGDESKWTRFDQQLQTQFDTVRAAKGAGFCVLAESTSSPTVGAVRKQLLEQMPEAGWFEYEPLSDDNERRGARHGVGHGSAHAAGGGQGARNRLPGSRSAGRSSSRSALRPRFRPRSRGARRQHEPAVRDRKPFHDYRQHRPTTGLPCRPIRWRRSSVVSLQEVQRLIDGGSAGHGGSSPTDKFLHAVGR